MKNSIGMAFLLVLSGCWWAKEQAPAQQTQLLVINVLDESFYNDAHIAGSINVPFMRLENYLQSVDVHVPLVFYCSNYACSASSSAATLALKMGFADVVAYEGGMAQWYQLKYPTQGAATQDYLQQVVQAPHEQASVPVISASDLKKKMEHVHLL